MKQKKRGNIYFWTSFLPSNIFFNEKPLLTKNGRTDNSVFDHLFPTDRFILKHKRTKSKEANILIQKREKTWIHWYLIKIMFFQYFIISPFIQTQLSINFQKHNLLLKLNKNLKRQYVNCSYISYTSVYWAMICKSSLCI